MASDEPVTLPVGFRSTARPGVVASRTIADGQGFLPVVVPISEPAVGMDVGVGPEETAVYFIVGSAWTGL